MKCKTPTGLFDILPKDEKEPWKSVTAWQHVENEIRSLSRLYGFHEIRTPIFERTELFEKGTGEDTDIVTKEMYTFEDRGSRSMTLRPEGTPPVMRAFIEHHLESMGPTHKLFYMGPMFRYERPQAGRYRQHHQFGAEAVGNDTPEQDVEIISLLMRLYTNLGIEGTTVQLNSLGTTDSREEFRTALRLYLEPHRADLSEDSRRRFDTNPLRILDSKDPKDTEIVAAAPSIIDFLDSGSRSHFESVQELLTLLEIPYEVNPRLVRGLDYYNSTVFEVTTDSLGAQNSIGGGGRYDGLLKQLGGPDLPSVGFASGMERIIQTMLAQEKAHLESDRPVVTFIALGEAARRHCFSFVNKMRNAGVPAVMDISNRKLGKAMKYADSIGSHNVIVVGDEELSSEEVTVKEMATGKEFKLSWDILINKFRMQANSLQSGGQDSNFGEAIGEGLQKTMEMLKDKNSPLGKGMSELLGKFGGLFNSLDEEKEEPPKKDGGHDGNDNPHLYN